MCAEWFTSTASGTQCEPVQTSVICSPLANLAVVVATIDELIPPVGPPVVRIEPDGDVIVLGVPLVDCPPYGTP